MDKKDFLKALASDAATPGGGGGSAYVGALGLSLSEMALTISAKTTKEEIVPTIQQLITQIKDLRNNLYGMIEADAEAFIPLSNAYKLSKSDPERLEKIQQGLVTAAQAPLDIMRMNYKAIQLHQKAMSLSNKMIVSDVGTGAIISQSSLKGAYMNVLVNTKSIKDKQTRSIIEEEATDLLEKGQKISEKVYSEILQLMR
ncbi:cyclodeaminase/cyclohydrolase family protein [Aerococcaceae bacterium WGS1372]